MREGDVGGNIDGGNSTRFVKDRTVKVIGDTDARVCMGAGGGVEGAVADYPPLIDIVLGRYATGDKSREDDVGVAVYLEEGLIIVSVAKPAVAVELDVAVIDEKGGLAIFVFVSVDGDVGCVVDFRFG